MSYTYKTLIRDKLVNNATVKGLFSATLTGSCRVNMADLTVSAAYPQIIISYGGGMTVSNMDADSSQLYLTVECKGTGTTHAYKELGLFRSAILSVIDDTSIASTAVCHLLRKFSEYEGFDEEKKVYWLRIGFTGDFVQNTNYP